MNPIFLGIIAVFFIILMLIYSSIFFKRTSLLNKFVEKLPIASHFIIGLGIFLTYLIFSITYEENVVKISDDINQEIIIGIFEMLEKHKHGCPNLIDSFFFTWQDYHSNKTHQMEDQHESAALVSNFIFERLEVFTESQRVTDLSDSKFLCFFSQFYISKLLKMEWSKYLANYGLKPRLLTQELFLINESNKFNSADELREYFERYVMTDKFKQIMNAVDKTVVGHSVSELAAI